MKDTIYFRVDGFSAIRHDDSTRKNLKELKELYPKKNQSDIVRMALIDYASNFGYNGNDAAKALEYVNNKIATILNDSGFGSGACVISSSGIVKKALQFKNSPKHQE